jgi:hypothetical protein
VLAQFQAQVDKIRNRPDRPTTFGGKDILMLLRVLMLLRKVFLFLPEKLRHGWNSSDIAHILLHLLDHRNQIHLRAHGFRLLVLWLNALCPEMEPDATFLYDNAIPLRGFSTSNESSERKSADLHVTGQEVLQIQDDPLPLMPDFQQLSPMQDGVHLLRLALNNIVRLVHVAAGIEPPAPEHDDDIALTEDGQEDGSPIAVGMSMVTATQVATFMLERLKRAYLAKFFPRAAYGEVHEEGRRVSRIEFWADPGMGFSVCPPAVLRLLLAFYIRYGVDPVKGLRARKDSQYSSVHDSYIQDTGSDDEDQASQANAASVRAVMKSILFGTEENRTFFRQALKQALTSRPIYEHLDVMRAGVHLIGLMLTGPVCLWCAYLTRAVGTRAPCLFTLTTFRSRAATRHAR